jgi:leucyl aminopeptidase (aminopeptidase T)
MNVPTETMEVATSADLVVHELLDVHQGEQVVLVCDPLSEMSMVHALASSVEAAGGEYTIFVMPERAEDRKNDLTPPIERGLEAADCLIGLTRSGGAPTYSRTVKRLLDAKRLRSISMVMRGMDNYTRGGATADYTQLLVDGEALAEIWRRADEVRVTSPAGTDLRAPIAGEAVIIECGYATQPGQEAAFSDGEVSQMPRAGSAEGVLVVDGPIAHIGLPDSPITIVVSSGRVTRVEGECAQAAELRRIVETIPDADNIAEIGIGLNPMCRRNGDFEEEKKARGLVHVAIGDNIFYGGSVECPVHMDMVLYAPTVHFDGRLVVDAGKVLLT